MKLTNSTGVRRMISRSSAKTTDKIVGVSRRLNRSDVIEKENAAIVDCLKDVVATLNRMVN